MYIKGLDNFSGCYAVSNKHVYSIFHVSGGSAVTNVPMLSYYEMQEHFSSHDFSNVKVSANDR